jgi:hypothetical protein
MYEEINNPALYALLGAAGLLAYYFLGTGLKALANRTNHFDILTPVFDSCLNCTGSHILAPSEVPGGVAVHELDKTMNQCREMMRDETRLTDKVYMEKWGWLYDEAPHDHTAIAGKCPAFTPKLVNRNGSIG